MATGTLTGQTIANTYKALLKITGTDAGGTTLAADAVIVIEDGDGNPSSLSLSQQRATITLGSGAADDFIVDGTTLVVEGDNNRIGIGTATPDYLVEIVKANGDHTSTALSITNSQAGGYGSALNFVSQRASGTTRAIAASIRTQGNASWANADETDSNLFFSTVVDGTLTDRMSILGTDGDVTLTTGHLVIDSDTKGLVLGADQDVTLFADGAGTAYLVRGTDVSPAGGDTEGWMKFSIGDSAGSYLSINGGEGGDAELYLEADGGDDNADVWRMTSSTGGDFLLASKSTGSYVTNLSVGGDGSHVRAKQPAFLVKPALGQDNIAINTAVTVVLGTEVYDQGGNFASNTFTAPRTGKYQFNLNVRMDNVDSAAVYYEARFATSNRTYTVFIVDPDFGQDAAYFTFNGSALADMDTNDTCTVVLYQSGGTAQTDVSTDSNFSGFLAC